VTAVRGSQKGPTAVALLVPLMVLALPLMDTSLAVVRRLYWLTSRGIQAPDTAKYMIRNFSNVFLPDRAHIHPRLLELGLSQRRAVILLYLVAGVFALCAFALVLLQSLWLGLLLVALLVGSLASFIAALYLRVRRLRASAAADREAGLSMSSKKAFSRPQTQAR
jgi:UDP-GlcNAc:undecaprenyl-phosphate GlcNAc-1-phosphate transferase